MATAPFGSAAAREVAVLVVAADLALPPNIAIVGRTYRVRVCVKDATGRWSHWSQPVEFTAGK